MGKKRQPGGGVVKGSLYLGVDTKVLGLLTQNGDRYYQVID